MPYDENALRAANPVADYYRGQVPQDMAGAKTQGATAAWMGAIGAGAPETLPLTGPGAFLSFSNMMAHLQDANGHAAARDMWSAYGRKMGWDK